eukprot:6401240-Prymnesium_polylepis.1
MEDTDLFESIRTRHSTRSATLLAIFAARAPHPLSVHRVSIELQLSGACARVYVRLECARVCAAAAARHLRRLHESSRLDGARRGEGARHVPAGFVRGAGASAGGR